MLPLEVVWFRWTVLIRHGVSSMAAATASSLCTVRAQDPVVPCYQLAAVTAARCAHAFGHIAVALALRAMDSHWRVLLNLFCLLTRSKDSK
jgi:hypothetical protein